VTTYKVLASREVYYEFEIEADSEEQASNIVQDIELTEDIEKYAYDWYPLEVFDTTDMEAGE
jgi:hypothetical protein